SGHRNGGDIRRAMRPANRAPRHTGRERSAVAPGSDPPPAWLPAPVRAPGAAVHHSVRAHPARWRPVRRPGNAPTAGDHVPPRFAGAPTPDSTDLPPIRAGHRAKPWSNDARDAAVTRDRPALPKPAAIPTANAPPSPAA